MTELTKIWASFSPLEILSSVVHLSCFGARRIGLDLEFLGSCTGSLFGYYGEFRGIFAFKAGERITWPQRSQRAWLAREHHKANADDLYESKFFIK